MTGMPGSVEHTCDSAGSLRSFRALLMSLQMAVVAVTATGENCQVAARSSNTCTERTLPLNIWGNYAFGAMCA